MPNDMSPLPPAPEAPHTENAHTWLSTRTARYCARADMLINDPGLTKRTATVALDHLAALQGDLAAERLRQTHDIKADLRRIEDRFKPLEGDLKQTRADLSNALLRAKPDEHDLFGLVPHGSNPDAVIDESEVSLPVQSGATRAVSASRALLDLEALRPYLSDQALRQAIDKHQKESEHCDLRGVAYAALPLSAIIPVDIY